MDSDPTSRRPAAARRLATPPPEVPEPRRHVEGAAASGGRSRGRGDRRPGTEHARSADTGGGRARRRSAPLRIADPHQLDLLLLAALARRPARGQDLGGTLRRQSNGVFDPPVQSVSRRLRRLATNRLIALDTRERRYSITPTGERVLASWSRQWSDYAYGVDEVLGRGHAGDRR